MNNNLLLRKFKATHKVIIFLIILIMMMPYTVIANGEGDSVNSTTTIEYVVTRGDTLSSVATKFNTNIEQLMRDNVITNRHLIFPGQTLIIRYGDQDYVIDDGRLVASVSIDVVDVEIDKVLTILGYYMNKDVVFTDASIDVTYYVEDVSPRMALELLIQSQNLSYLEDNGVIMVGSRQHLKDNFFTQMGIVEYNLKYIKSSDIFTLWDGLGISLDKIKMDSNPYVLWIKGTPQELETFGEFVNMVDQRDAIDGNTVFMVKLTNITVKELSERMAPFGLEDVIVLPGQYQEFSKDAILKSPDHMLTEVKRIVDALDEQTISGYTGKIKMPVAAASGDNAIERLIEIRGLLIDLIEEIDDVSGEIYISNDLSGTIDITDDNRILIVYETPSVINKVKAMLEVLDSLSTYDTGTVLP